MGVNYDSQAHRRGSATLSDYDYIRSLSEDKCLFCLTEQQATFILGLLYSARSTNRWFSAGAMDNDWLDSFFSELRTELMTDNCNIAAQIQSLADCCANLTYQLKVIEDNMCVSQAMALNFYRAGVVAAGQTAFPDTTFSNDTSITDQQGLYAAAGGLCATIYRYITSVLADQLTRDALTVGLIAGGAGVINPILGVIAAGIGSAALADFALAVADQSAIDDVACCMYKALRDAEPTFDNWKTCLDDCGFSFPDNNATLAGAVGLSLNDEANYLSFVSTLKNETSKALADNPDAYPTCGSCTCTDVVDFTNGEMGDWELVVGTRDGANGILSVDNTDNPFSSHHAVIRLRRKFAPTCDVANVKIEYKWTSDDEGRPTTGSNNTIYWHIETSGCTDPWNTTSGATAIGGGTGPGPNSVDTAMPSSVSINDVNCIEIHDVTAVYKWYIRKIWINP